MQQQEIRYLYGAAVQGIQSFIFQTNELKDIVGASELVENICTECFKEFEHNCKVIVKAAGNIKCIFFDESDCKKAVREFPKKIMTLAPGITISEAVVTMSSEQGIADVIDELESKLKAQRNKPFLSLTRGLMCIERSPKTGLPAVAFDEIPIDKGTLQKRYYQKWDKDKKPALFNKFFGDGVTKANMSWNIEDMTSNNSWIAVIHADGNGLGDIISRIGKDEDQLSKFSDNLSKATSDAAKRAYEDVVKSKDYSPDANVIPFRPVVLGGDDVTLICRADLAIYYTQQFITHFQENTKKLMSNISPSLISLPHLTACAGIAFIKSSYPFYYGYQLAEELCNKAKVDAKKDKKTPAPSCILFHKVQSSFIDDYEEIARRELIPYENHSYEFGPYYLEEKDDRWTIKKLVETTKSLNGKEGNAIKSDIRQWMTLMAERPEKAKQKKIRVEKITKNELRQLFKKATDASDREGKTVYPAYDMLMLHSISTKTKNKKTKIK